MLHNVANVASGLASENRIGVSKAEGRADWFTWVGTVVQSAAAGKVRPQCNQSDWNGTIYSIRQDHNW